MRAANERGSDRYVATRSFERERSPAYKRNIYVAGGKISLAVLRTRHPLCSVATQFAGQFRSPFVIDVYYRRCRTFAKAAVKQLPFGREVLLHRAVIIEVVTSQV